MCVRMYVTDGWDWDDARGRGRRNGSMTQHARRGAVVRRGAARTNERTYERSVHIRRCTPIWYLVFLHAAPLALTQNCHLWKIWLTFASLAGWVHDAAPCPKTFPRVQLACAR